MFEAFQLGPLIIWTHLLFLLIAIWTSSEFFFRLAQSAGLSLQPFRDHPWWYLGGAFLGGRVFAVLEQYRVYLKWEDPLRMFMVHDGNFSFLGMSVGIIVVLALTRKTSRITFLQWLDVLLPATAFGLTFDWLGKFAAGQAYGRPSDHWWSVTYDAISVRFAVPIHPVQLYYALFYFILTFLLLVVRKNARRAGAETLIGIVLAAVATFVFEFFRGDFGIPVFATSLDLILLILLFVSLAVFAAVEILIPSRWILVSEIVITVFCAVYIFFRRMLPLTSYELRFSQLLSILALLGAIVYVVIHRRRHPHL